MQFNLHTFAVFFVYVTLSNLVFEVIAHCIRQVMYQKEAKRINKMIEQAKSSNDNGDGVWH